MEEEEGLSQMGGVHGMGAHKNVLHRSIGLMVAGGNTSWERMYGSVIITAMRKCLCFCRRYSTISMLNILVPRQYSCRILAFLRLKKDSSIRTKVSGTWQTACIQSSKRGFVMSQDDSM